MTIPTENMNMLWSGLIVDELIRQGIDYFCLSPGSRSTPLTTAVARHKKARKIVIYDERSAAFHALGFARATGKPAVLVCTSGTAAANYLPAIIEAHQENVPLIVLSADRPPELRDSGANQTIDQIKLFGSYVRWFFDLPTPTTALSPSFVLGRVDRLVHKAFGPPAGPVHLNVMLREPLAPEVQPPSQEYTASLKDRGNSHWPQTRLASVEQLPSDLTLEEVRKIVQNTERGLVIVGGLPPTVDRAVLVRCLNRLGWVTLADVTSGLRLGYDWRGFVPHLDLLLTDHSFRFDTVLHLGDRYVSKRMMLHLQKHPPQTYLRVSTSEHWIDPAQTVTHLVQASPEAFCRLLEDTLVSNADSRFARDLRQRSNEVERLLKVRFDASEMNQIALARMIANEIPTGHGLFLANSLAVREVDMFAQRLEGPVVTTANRGASGIDGNISTAAGLAAGLQKPVTLLIGDLAFLHDLNALSLLRHLKQPLIIVLVNNGGGGIFHWLPIARFDDVFETYFATPHAFTFESSARQFHLSYWQPDSLQSLRQAYREALKNNGSSLIEVRTDRRENATMYRRLLEEIASQNGDKA